MKFNRVFARLFLSYSIVLLFPLILFVFIYNLTTRVVVEQTIKVYENSLRRGSDLISRNIQDLKLVAESMIYDELIKSFLEARSFSGERLYDLYIQKDALVKYSFFSSVAQICLYSGANGYLLVPGGGVFLSEIIYNASFSFTGMDYTQWNNFIQQKPINGFYTFPKENAGGNPNLLYFLRLSPEAGYLVIHVDTAIIHENLMQITESTGGLSFLLGEQNQLVYLYNGSNNPEEAAALVRAFLSGESSGRDSGGRMVFECTDKAGWKLVSLVPYKSVNKNNEILKNQMIWFTAGILATGLVVCYLLTRNRAHALTQVMAYINSLLSSTFTPPPPIRTHHQTVCTGIRMNLPLLNRPLRAW
jgi:hypothetical protein